MGCSPREKVVSGLNGLLSTVSWPNATFFCRANHAYIVKSRIIALKSKHAAIRGVNAELLPAILERIFSMEEQSHG